MIDKLKYQLVKIKLLPNTLFSQRHIFRQIFKNNGWKNKESRSGPGSTLEQTAKIRVEIQKLFQDLEIKSILDVPCGDFNWMKEINLEQLSYTGMDIVPELIEDNNKKYGDRNKKFVVGDITKDKIPAVDLIICRDCLVHFSYKNITKAINNLKKSGARYLLATSFPHHENEDIITGDWRPINLEKEPFRLPIPHSIINEQCSEGNGIYADKSLCLWELSRI